MRKLFLAAVSALVLVATGDVHAAGAPKPAKQQWSFDGIFGVFDQAQLRRGLQIYTEVCASCHSLDLVPYRTLSALGMNEAEIKALAGEAEVTDGPDEEGEMFTRPAGLADAFAPPFANANAARAANNGALPPDLSLMTKARIGGPDYVYALMTGYKEETPAGVKLLEGMNYNEFFSGHQIAMAPPLADEAVEYIDGTKPTLDQHARDITSFLVWAAEPELEERKNMGIKVILFLIVMTAMLYALKRQVWAKLH
jgi:ubiquinol-cytochrome c reductase cytochrome c1 subunit